MVKILSILLISICDVLISLL